MSSMAVFNLLHYVRARGTRFAGRAFCRLAVEARSFNGTHARQTPAPALQVVPPAFHDAFIHGRAQACLHWSCRLHAGSVTAFSAVGLAWRKPNPREKFARTSQRVLLLASGQRLRDG